MRKTNVSTRGKSLLSKGFTLIELLAVIVILAIITLIAIPIILNIIKDSKESTTIRSAENYLKAVKLAMTKENMNEEFNPSNCTVQENGNLLCTGYKNEISIEVDGEIPEEGTKIKFEEGKIVAISSFKISNTSVEASMLGLEEYVSKICKRAKKLHTEICTQDNETFFCGGQGISNGTTITFGNQNVEKKVLKSGDAFDCDVNGDGEYNSTNERFYYVSDYYDEKTKTFKDDIAVLIYYNNTTKGNPDNTESNIIAYHEDYKNNGGPLKGVENLPSTHQWKNIKLINPIRQITNELGETTTIAGDISLFDYNNYSTRLITTQEIMNGCNLSTVNSGFGELNKCNFLMQNTSYALNDAGINGYWIETPKSYDNGIVYAVSGFFREVNADVACNTQQYGVRPVIEVKKTDIEF